jgi:hypothetical protein
MTALFRRRPRPAMFAPPAVGTPRPVVCGAAVALPGGFGATGSQSDARTHTQPDPVHAGSDDLLMWPPSAVEQLLATEWVATGCPSVRDELYTVCQSVDRAAAICEKTYIDQRAQTADVLLARAFGTVRP